MSLWRDTALVGNHPPDDYHGSLGPKQKKTGVSTSQRIKLHSGSTSFPCSHMQPSWWLCRHPVGMGCRKVSKASSTWCPTSGLVPCVWRSWNSASWELHVLIDRESTHVHSMDWIEVTECWIHLSVMIHKQAETCHSSCVQNNSLQSGHKLHIKDVFRTCWEPVFQNGWPILSRSTMHIHLSRESEIPR